MKNTLESLKHAAIDADQLTEINGGDFSFLGITFPFPSVHAAGNSSVTGAVQVPGVSVSGTSGGFWGFKF